MKGGRQTSPFNLYCAALDHQLDLNEICHLKKSSDYHPSIHIMPRKSTNSIHIVQTRKKEKPQQRRPSATYISAAFSACQKKYRPALDHQLDYETYHPKKPNHSRPPHHIHVMPHCESANLNRAVRIREKNANNARPSAIYIYRQRLRLAKKKKTPTLPRGAAQLVSRSIHLAIQNKIPLAPYPWATPKMVPSY